jgi:guanylate kinase
VIDHLRPVLPDVHFSVTATTRPRRPNEIDGIHYYFLTLDDFLQQQREGDFVESAVVYGNHYGVPRAPLGRALERGQDVVVKVDVQGATALEELAPDAVTIFLAPESMDELFHRLQTRQTDDPDAVMRRFSRASQELLLARDFDYVVFNESERLDAAIEQIVAIITAERLRSHQPHIEL